MRRIIPGDLSDPRVVALLQTHLASARADSPPESVHALDLAGLQAPDICFWALWDDEALLGVGALKRLAADHGEIKSMHVAAAGRRQGAGGTMLRHVIAAAREAGMARLSLETGASDYFLPARRLYERHGFVPCPPFASYRPDPYSLFMALDVKIFLS